MSKSYIIGFKNKSVDLYDTNGNIIRRFKAKADVVNAQITSHNNNPAVAITTKDGHFELYKTDGTIIKRN